jgi:hypothetical protein
MKKPVALVALTICSFACCEVSSVAQEQFKKLSGAEIRAKFTGMEFTDEVHWDEIYGENGNLIGEEMGKRRVGTRERQAVYGLRKDSWAQLLRGLDVRKECPTKNPRLIGSPVGGISRGATSLGLQILKKCHEQTRSEERHC